MTYKSTAIAAAICLLAETNARITDNGLWDNNDWYDGSIEIGI